MDQTINVLKYCKPNYLTRYKRRFKHEYQTTNGRNWKFKPQHAYKDYDNDGKVNRYDCQPLNPNAQDIKRGRGRPRMTATEMLNKGYTWEQIQEREEQKKKQQLESALKVGMDRKRMAKTKFEDYDEQLQTTYDNLEIAKQTNDKEAQQALLQTLNGLLHNSPYKEEVQQQDVPFTTKISKLQARRKQQEVDDQRQLLQNTLQEYKQAINTGDYNKLQQKWIELYQQEYGTTPDKETKDLRKYHEKQLNTKIKKQTK